MTSESRSTKYWQNIQLTLGLCHVNSFKMGCIYATYLNANAASLECIKISNDRLTTEAVLALSFNYHGVPISRLCGWTCDEEAIAGETTVHILPLNSFINGLAGDSTVWHFCSYGVAFNELTIIIFYIDYVVCLSAIWFSILFLIAKYSVNRLVFEECSLFWVLSLFSWHLPRICLLLFVVGFLMLLLFVLFWKRASLLWSKGFCKEIDLCIACSFSFDSAISCW